MLHLKFEKIMLMRGIAKPQQFLVANGFTPTVAYRLLHQSDSKMKYEYIEKLCLLLRCTPNDMLEWVPGKDQPLDNQPLAALRKKESTAAIAEFLKTASFEKIEELHTLMIKAKNGDGGAGEP